MSPFSVTFTGAAMGIIKEESTGEKQKHALQITTGTRGVLTYFAMFCTLTRTWENVRN